jgi:ABC-type multidrug transport system ATPase subunit
MTIYLSNASKRFNRDWIFKNLSYTFNSGTAYVITGPNGSGKSTLLQAISGSSLLNEGTITYSINNNKVADEEVYKDVSICAPYLELIEEMTALEFLNFHSAFKPFLRGIDSEKAIEIIGLQKARNKQIRYFSSGMKQRIKLAQCILSNTAIVLLDEPCTNLDVDGIALYHSMITNYCKDRLVIVSSNDETEYRFCTERIHISDYK